MIAEPSPDPFGLTDEVRQQLRTQLEQALKR